MLPPGLKSPQEVVEHYDRVYYDLLDSGKARPFLYPWGAIGALVVLAAFLIDFRASRARRLGVYAAYAFCVLFHVWCLITHRARNPAAAFGVGLLSAFGTLWVGAVGSHVLSDGCRRIERSEGHPDLNGHAADGDAAAKASGTEKMSNGKGELQQRRAQGTVQDSGFAGPAHRHGSLFWQSYPSTPLIERIDWVADAFCSLRGVGWSWQTNGIPPPPKWVDAQLRGESSAVEKVEPISISKTGIRRFSDRQALVMDCARCLMIGYIALDGIKSLGLHDEYMWGYIDAAPPAFLPLIVRGSFMLTRIYRLSISLSAIYTALWAIFKMGPVFFCGIVGPKYIGLRGEAWMNPADMFGSFSTVLDQGLAGWWGGWWHQTFRFVFELPADWLRAKLGIEKRSASGKLLSVLVAFFLSGCLHASGSYTQLGDTRPFLGPFRFFMLQAVGITIQTLLVQLLKAIGLTDKIPKVVRQAGNFIIVHVWMYHTAPLLCDDFARGGIWLFEPVPFSIFRGLGLGPKGTGWWCWHDFVRWRSGEHWWDTGIAF